jgi:signal transduction histidine kinase
MLVGLSQTALAANDNPSPPNAESGSIDVSGWDFSQLGPIKLDGTWSFYSEALWSQNQALPGAPPLALRVPGSWGSQKEAGLSLSNQSYGTYRLQINLGGQRQVKALYMPSVATAYQLWVNGELLAANGRVGTKASDMTAKNYARVVILPPADGKLDIAIQVSNFVQRKGGLWESIRFGNANDIIRLREHNVTMQLIFVVSNLVFCLYHAALFLFRRSDKASLFLSLLCGMIALRTLLLGDTLLVYWFPDIPWELAVKMEYLSAYIAMSLFPMFLAQLYPAESNRRIVNIFLWNGVVFGVPVIVLPALLYTRLLQVYELVTLLSFPYMLLVLFRAARNGREGAKASIAAGVVLLLAVLNDIAYYNEFIRSIEASSHGVLIFVFVQTLIISYRFSRAYQKSEQLSFELQRVNLTLEEKVKERTAELMQSNASLQEVNQSLHQMVRARRQLLSNISHELGTPMTIILGYVNAVIDGIVSGEQQRKYMQSVHNKIFFMQRIIRDLFDLSKLEGKQVEFTFIRTRAAQPIEDAVSMNEVDLESDGVQVVLSSMDKLPTDGELYVSVDSIRMQQVFTNLIQNASKFTPAGGRVEIGCEWLDADSRVRYFVKDNGKGIAPEALPRVFDRFFQDANNRPTNAGGSGLGLAIAKEIIEQHDGQIGVTSKEGVGTTVFFDIPAELVRRQP